MTLLSQTWKTSATLMLSYNVSSFLLLPLTFFEIFQEIPTISANIFSTKQTLTLSLVMEWQPGQFLVKDFFLWTKFFEKWSVRQSRFRCLVWPTCIYRCTHFFKRAQMLGQLKWNVFYLCSPNSKTHKIHFVLMAFTGLKLEQVQTSRTHQRSSVDVSCFSTPVCLWCLDHSYCI